MKWCWPGTPTKQVTSPYCTSHAQHLFPVRRLFAEGRTAEIVFEVSVVSVVSDVSERGKCVTLAGLL